MQQRRKVMFSTHNPRGKSFFHFFLFPDTSPSAFNSLWQKLQLAAQQVCGSQCGLPWEQRAFSTLARMSLPCITNDFTHDCFCVGRATDKMEVVVPLDIQMFLSHQRTRAANVQGLGGLDCMRLWLHSLVFAAYLYCVLFGVDLAKCDNLEGFTGRGCKVKVSLFKICFVFLLNSATQTTLLQLPSSFYKGEVLYLL